MNVLLLSVRIAAQSVQSVFKKTLNKKCGGCEFSISAVIAFFALAYFIIFSDDFVFEAKILPYCIIFAICFAAATVSCVLALACGSMGLTDLILVYSTAIPLGYSLIFCDESLNGIQIAGVALLALSFLLTYLGGEGKTKGQKTGLKWVLYAIILFVSNGMCGVIMQMQQIKFNAAHDDSFMIISLVLVVLLLLVAALIREGAYFTVAVKRGWALCALCGASNGVMNYFSFLCLLRIPGSIYYPITSAGALILSYVLSITVFKERFAKNQAVGFILAVISMIFVNIN